MKYNEKRVQKSDVAAHWARNAKVISNRTITEQSIWEDLDAE